MSEIVDVTSLIGGAVEQIMAEIAESGSWRDRRKAQWLLAKLETCIANHDEFAALREPMTPAGIFYRDKGDFRFYLYNRWELDR